MTTTLTAAIEAVAAAALQMDALLGSGSRTTDDEARRAMVTALAELQAVAASLEIETERLTPPATLPIADEEADLARIQFDQQ